MPSDNQLTLTITQDKLLDILMHAATREDIAKLDQKIDDVENRMEAKFGKIDQKFADLENKMNARFEKIDNKFDAMDNKFDKIDSKFDKIDSKFDKIDGKFDKKIDDLGNKMDACFKEARKDLEAKYNKVLYFIFAGILVPIALQTLPQFIKYAN